MAKETWYDGVAASPGIAMGKARRFEPVDIDVEESALAESEIADEISRFRQATSARRMAAD